MCTIAHLLAMNRPDLETMMFGGVGGSIRELATFLRKTVQSLGKFIKNRSVCPLELFGFGVLFLVFGGRCGSNCKVYCRHQRN
jgi:hypothetical protein